MTLTAQPRSPLSLYSGALFSWRSDVFSLTAITGQAATWARAATATCTDAAGVAYTAVNGQPGWQWTSNVPGLLLGASDSLTFPFAHLPQAMTIYCVHVERGTAAADKTLWSIGKSDLTAPALYLAGNGGKYTILHNNGSSSVSRTASVAPSAAQVCETRAVLKSDGSVYLGQSIDSAVETVTTASGTLALAAAWSAPTVLCLNGAGANVGTNEFRRVLVLAGEQTMATCRSTL